jgi:hypothetical protein
LLLQDSATDEPLAVQSVIISKACEQALAECYGQLNTSQQSLLGSAEHLSKLTKQVLSLDFRSFHQRSSKELPAEQSSQQMYNVKLAGVRIGYTIDASGVQMCYAELAPLQ